MIKRAKKAKPGYRQVRRAGRQKVVNDPTGGQRNFAAIEERKATGAFSFFHGLGADFVSARAGVNGPWLRNPPRLDQTGVAIRR
jgi:hypothetical protein